MASMASVENFVSKKNIAIVGVSRAGKKFGNAINKELKKKGYNTYIVNPHADNIDGQKSYSKLTSIPGEVESVLISVPPAETLNVVKDTKEAGIKNVWMQQGAQSDEAIQFCEENKIDYVAKECILMFAEPVEGGHKFHRWIWKLFGKLPK